MHIRFTKRGVTTLLLLALLIVTVAIVLPIVASASGTPAESGEIEDFSYQTLTGADVTVDAPTDLRFLFSINNLDYTAVGFVFSKSDDPVKTGTKQSGNFTESTTVYRSVTANSEAIPAPNGRYWVAANLRDIPHASFATYLYIRPYVEDGSGTRYGETRRINVCEALGHVHEIKNPTGTATLLNPGTRIGDCDACGLTDITELDVRAAVADTLNAQKFLKDHNDASEFDRYVYVNTTAGDKQYSPLKDDQTYYPSSENNWEGRDFYFQIDMLWNETMLNSIQNKLILCFWKDGPVPLFYFTPNAYADRYGKINGSISNDKGDNPWSGGFDWTNGNDTLEGPAGGVGCLFDRYPNLNNSGDEQDWGWHRIGVRVHEDADWNSQSHTVTYSGEFYLYIDGEMRWRVSLNPYANSFTYNKNNDSLTTKGALLFTRDPSTGEYQANNTNFYFDFWATDIDYSTSEVHMVTTNPTSAAVIPSQFSAGVVPVSDPAPSKFVLKNDTAVDARVWFMAEHDHVWDGNEVLTREATVLQAGKKAEHCTLCGAEKETGTSVAFVPTVYTSVNGTYGEEDSVSGYGLGKSLSSIRGSEHFFAKNGHSAKNLYFEYSILWNNTLQNWDDVTERAEMKVITFLKDGTHKELYLLYSREKTKAEADQYNTEVPGFWTSNDCPFANHFDFSCFSGGVGAVYDSGPIAGYDDPITESSSPSISYGWHRIGVLVHQEASKGSGTKVNYSGWSELYVDGVKVWKVKSDVSTLASNNISLFKATNDGTNLSYSDTNPDVRCRFDRFATSGSPAYAVFGEAYWRIVDTDFDPTTEIEPVVSPAAVDYIIPGTSVHVNAAVYFKAAD